MVIRNLKSGRRLAVFALFAILAMSAFGFAASNVVPATNAGDGSEDVSGGTVSDVDYNVNANGLIEGVTFTYTTSVAPETARVALLDLNGDVIAWSNDCTGTPASFDCDFTAPEDIEPVMGLRVITFD